MMKMDETTWHIMDAMAEDWESVAQIEPHVRKFCGAVPRSQINKTLVSLHKAGLVQAMDGDGNGISELPRAVTGTWFRMTSAGRTAWDTEGRKYRDK